MIRQTVGLALAGMLLAPVGAWAQTPLGGQGTAPASNPPYRPSANPQYAPATPPPAAQPPNRQYGPSPGQSNQAPPARPDQPVTPRDPRLDHLPSPRAAQPAPQPPFRISPEHETYLNRVLVAWEHRGAEVKTFECGFARFEYDRVFNKGNAQEPVNVDAGRIKYRAPDQGVFEVSHTRQDGEWVPIDENRREHWVCDGKSIYEFNYQKEQLIERQLPAELQGQAISNGPLPFLFGAKAAELKGRYWMRVVTPPQVQDSQIWLEAYPRHRADAAEFKRAEVILSLSDLTLQGLRIESPNEKQWKTFKFENVNVNERRGPFSFLRSDPFRPDTPRGWKKIVEPPPTASAAPQIGQRPHSSQSR